MIAVLALVLSGAAVAVAGGDDGGQAITPAPPPASYCRAAPPAGWPTIGTTPAPDLTPFQDYRAGLGIPPGLDGSGVRIADVEYEWTREHVDLAPRGLPAAPATGLPALFRARDHGTAVLAVLGAEKDGRGITGLATGATLLPISPFLAVQGSRQTAYDPARAITLAADGLGAGDVLLVELQSQILSERGLLLGPIEYYSSVRAAIAKAVDRGIVVVEPAGNGGLDIGTLGPSWLSNPSDPLATGALLVGAGGSGLAEPAVPDRERVPGSNYGARVDLQGFGTAVVTAGYADLSSAGAGAERAYTACFDGTSSASATVAGAVAVLQEAAIAGTGSPLTPAAVRELLVETGLPQAPTPGEENASPESIGPRPQVDAAIAALTPPAYSPADELRIDIEEPPATITPPAVAAAPVPVPVPFTPGAAPPATAWRTTIFAPAARGLSVRFLPAKRRMVVRLRGAAPSAVVRKGSRNMRVRSGRVVIPRVRPGRFVLRVRARAHLRTTYRQVWFRITVPRTGRPRVVRLRS